MRPIFLLLAACYGSVVVQPGDDVEPPRAASLSVLSSGGGGNDSDSDAAFHGSDTFDEPFCVLSHNRFVDLPVARHEWIHTATVTGRGAQRQTQYALEVTRDIRVPGGAPGATGFESLGVRLDTSLLALSDQDETMLATVELGERAGAHATISATTEANWDGHLSHIYDSPEPDAFFAALVVDDASAPVPDVLGYRMAALRRFPGLRSAISTCIGWRIYTAASPYTTNATTEVVGAKIRVLVKPRAGDTRRDPAIFHTWSSAATLTLWGECPGRVHGNLSSMLGEHLLVIGDEGGDDTIPAGDCLGTPVGVHDPAYFTTVPPGVEDSFGRSDVYGSFIATQDQCGKVMRPVATRNCVAGFGARIPD